MNAEQYDYEAIHRAVCPGPETLTQGQRENRVWPASKDMIDFLALVNSQKWQESKSSTPVTPAYYQAMNNQLLSAPYKGWDNGARAIKHRLTSKGKAYLCYLKVTHPAPIRALTVVKACTALVVEGHWERLTDRDMINQAQDATFSILISARASTYSMVAGMAI